MWLMIIKIDEFDYWFKFDVRCVINLMFYVECFVILR